MLDDSSNDRALAHDLVSSGRLAPTLLEPFQALPYPRPALARWLVQTQLLAAEEALAYLQARHPEAWIEGGRIGDYVLRKRLGAGGMGEVWHAVERTSGGQRAIKTLLRSATPKHGQRFEREVEALTKLDGHPNVVRVHAAGNADGRPYVVLDYAPGGDLAERLERGPLEPGAARRILVELATGLAHVHRHGLLHRDLKPQNVLFAEDGRAMLTDFGVVRGADHEALTLSGQLVGTLSYMAPEQAHGGAFDQRTDVYGLGAILYHMLTGDPPSSALFNAMRPPSDTNPSAPRDLVRVCVKAMAREPNRRYPSAKAFAEALLEPERTSSAFPLGLALLAAALGVAGVSWALLRGKQQAPRNDTPAALSTTTAPPPVNAALPSADRLALDAFLASLPPPDLEHAKGISPSNGVILGVSRMRTAADALRMRKLYRQASAFYVAAVEEGDVDCWARLARMLTDDELEADGIELEDRVPVIRGCLERGADDASPTVLLRLGGLHWLPNALGYPLDLAIARRYYARAVEVASEFEATEPGRAAMVRREAYMNLANMTHTKRGTPDAASALEGLELTARLEGMQLQPDERTAMRAVAWALFKPACAELIEILKQVELEPPEEVFSADDVLHVQIYGAELQPTRYGMLYRDAGRAREAAACFAVGSQHDGRAWYELYRLLETDGHALLGGEFENVKGFLCACVVMGSKASDPACQSVLSNARARGRAGWPLEIDLVKATKLSRAGLETAEDADLIAELHVQLATIAIKNPDLAGCPTLDEGREHLRLAATQKRPAYAPILQDLRARYAAREQK